MKNEIEYIYHELCCLQGMIIELSCSHPEQVNIHLSQRLDDLTSKVGKLVDRKPSSERVADAILKITQRHYGSMVDSLRDERIERERLALLAQNTGKVVRMSDYR